MKTICMTIFNSIAVLTFGYGTFISRLSQWYWALYLMVSFMFYAMILVIHKRE